MTQELRKLAEAATQGPWIAGDDEDSDYYLVGPPSFGTVVTNPVVQIHALNNAEFIAAANPAAILALLDRLEKTEKEPEITPAMIEAAEEVEDLYRRGTPDTWAKVFRAMWRAMEASK